MQEYVKWPGIREELSTHLSNKESGTFFIATDDNASCRLGIRNGEITHCIFRRVRGKEALTLLPEINSATCSLSDVQFPFRPQDAVSHATALDRLGIDVQSVVDREPPKKRSFYRGLLQTSGDAETAPPPRKKKPRYYRGQLVETQEMAAPSESASQPSKRKPRYYRGQLIEE